MKLRNENAGVLAHDSTKAAPCVPRPRGLELRASEKVFWKTPAESTELGLFHFGRVGSGLVLTDGIPCPMHRLRLAVFQPMFRGCQQSQPRCEVDGFSPWLEGFIGDPSLLGSEWEADIVAAHSREVGPNVVVIGRLVPTQIVRGAAIKQTWSALGIGVLNGSHIAGSESMVHFGARDIGEQDFPQKPEHVIFCLS